MKSKWINELPVLRELGSQGITMLALAEKYGVSRQRIKQVLNTFIPEWESTYGMAVRRDKAEKEYNDKYFKKWGKREDTQLYKQQRDRYLGKKGNALGTGYTWNLDFSDIEWNTHCPILGLELDYFATMRQENSPSFDRVDSNLGYEKGNVVVMSWRANRIKNNGTAEEHHKIANYLDTLQHTYTCKSSTLCDII